MIEQEVSFADFTGGSSGRSPSQYALAEIGPAIAQERGRINRLQEEATAEMAFSLICGRSTDLWSPPQKQREQAIANARYQLNRFRTEPQRRWSGGFSCLGFALIGVPMAIRRRHGEFWGSFFACFLPILVVFYPMLAVTVEQAKVGGLPPVAVWLGNLVLAAWGVWLMRRVMRY